MDNTFCMESMKIWKFVGEIVTIIKICIPVLILVLGIIDLGKAVVSSQEKEVGKAAGQLLKRFLAGVIIFFIPTLVNLGMGLIDDASDLNYKPCTECVANPKKCVLTDETTEG